MNAKTILQIYELVVKNHQLVNPPVIDVEINEKDKKHLEILDKIFDLCRSSPYFFEPAMNDDGNLNFDFVTSEWIRKMIEDFGIKNKDLADGVNVGTSQISVWLSGERNPSGPAQAAIYYYFKSLV